jgi:CHAT domain-containing protein
LAAGNLTLREILTLDAFRDSRMAVLSACQTALTDFLRSTDEAIGLPAGFLMAGVTGVVGTLWSVHDRSTALTMTRFYELQLRGGPKGTTLPPASALCQAQRWLRDLTQEEMDRYLLSHPSLGRSAALPPLAPHARPFSDPFYWAAFVFVGA